jgi:HNH endonuclease
MGYSRRRPPKTHLMCKECLEEKSVEAFYRHTEGEPWRRQPCKACISLKHRQPPKVKPMEKRCNACGVTKPLEEFSLVGRLDSRWPRSRMPLCIPCRNLKTQQRRAKRQAEDPEAYAAQLGAWGKQWRDAHPDKVQAIAARRRARENNAPYIDDVSLDVLYKRDKGICQICHTRCSRKEATRDHIIPVSCGGETSYRNEVLAHRRCNSGKRDRAIPQQMRLIG